MTGSAVAATAVSISWKKLFLIWLGFTLSLGLSVLIWESRSQSRSGQGLPSSGQGSQHGDYTRGLEPRLFRMTANRRQIDNSRVHRKREQSRVEYVKASAERTKGQFSQKIRHQHHHHHHPFLKFRIRQRCRWGGGLHGVPAKTPQKTRQKQQRADKEYKLAQKIDPYHTNAIFHHPRTRRLVFNRKSP